MVKRVLHAIIELQLWQMKFWRQGALQDTSCERSIGSFKHAIEVHCCLSLHGILHLIQFPPQALLHMIVTMHGLLNVIRAANFFVMSAAVASLKGIVTALRTHLTLQLFILFH